MRSWVYQSAFPRALFFRVRLLFRGGMFRMEHEEHGNLCFLPSELTQPGCRRRILCSACKKCLCYCGDINSRYNCNPWSVIVLSSKMQLLMVQLGIYKNKHLLLWLRLAFSHVIGWVVIKICLDEKFPCSVLQCIWSHSALFPAMVHKERVKSRCDFREIQASWGELAP